MATVGVKGLKVLNFWQVDILIELLHDGVIILKSDTLMFTGLPLITAAAAKCWISMIPLKLHNDI